MTALALVLVLAGGCSRAQRLDEFVGRDIGTVGLSGSHTIRDDVLVALGSGADIWSESDSFYFVSTLRSGDTEVISRIDHLDETHPWAKAGVMVRASLDPGSPNVTILMAAQGRAKTMPTSTTSSTAPGRT